VDAAVDLEAGRFPVGETAVENSDMARRLSQFGIGAEPAAGNTSGVRPVVTEQDPKMVGKLRFSDLNSAAQDRLRAQELQRLMRQAYGYLRMRVGSSWTLDEVRPHLIALGLPVPVIETSFAGYIYDADGNEKYLSSRVKGELTQEQAEANLTSVGSGNPDRRMLIAAFGEGNLVESQLPSDVHSVRVDAHTKWADEDTILVPGAEEPTDSE